MEVMKLVTGPRRSDHKDESQDGVTRDKHIDSSIGAVTYGCTVYITLPRKPTPVRPFHLCFQKPTDNSMANTTLKCPASDVATKLILEAFLKPSISNLVVEEATEVSGFLAEHYY